MGVLRYILPFSPSQNVNNLTTNILHFRHPSTSEISYDFITLFTCFILQTPRLLDLGKFGLKIKLYSNSVTEENSLLKTQNKLTLSYNYSKNTSERTPLNKENRISWKNKKLPTVSTAQSSTAVKAVVRELTN
jgi:hypothetical protein